MAKILISGELGGLLPGQRVELDDALDLVAEQGQAPGAVFQMGGEEFEDIALDAEGAAEEGGFVALVLQFDRGAAPAR